MIKTGFLEWFLLCSLSPFVGHSQTANGAQQSDDFVVESVLLHTDRGLYISGETIWFKMYVLDAAGKGFSEFSKVGYLELIGPDGTAISRVKAALEDGQSAGAVRLPEALPNGYYILRAYTQGLRNIGEEAFAKTSLIILNPDQPLIRPVNETAAAGSTVEYGPSSSPPMDRQLEIDIQTDQPAFPQRSRAAVEITTRDANGRPVSAQVSLSIALTGLDIGRQPPAGRPAPPATISFQPETDGMLLNGKVINRTTGAGSAAEEVFLAFPGKPALVYAAKTDETGAFSFLLPKLFGLRQMVVQVRPKNTTPLLIELADEFHEVERTDPEPFILPPDLATAARTALVNAQIEQAYRAFALPPVYTADNTFDSIPFYGRHDVRYLLDDFTRFPLPEFFFEVVPEVRVRGKYGMEELKVLNDWESTGVETPPLLLVDGVPVFDQRTFLKINNQLIVSTEVVTAPFWLNPALFDGIIQLSSFEGDARCFALPETALRRSFLAILPQQQFPAPDYGDNPDSHLPDFRNTLYWNPMIQTDVQGKATVSFYTSDAVGEYIVRAKGGAENGLTGSGRGTLRVAKAK